MMPQNAQQRSSHVVRAWVPVAVMSVVGVYGNESSWSPRSGDVRGARLRRYQGHQAGAESWEVKRKCTRKWLLLFPWKCFIELQMCTALITHEDTVQMYRQLQTEFVS